MDHSVATSPTPADKSSDMPRDAALVWTPGPYAATHDVYLGTVFEDVNTASRIDPRGVLVSQAQDTNEYVPSTVLRYGQVYYWRIDEVNAAPDTAIFKGKVWSFTVEPLAYPITAGVVKAVASGSASEAEGPARTVDNSGLDNVDSHSSRKTDMWLSDSVAAGGSAWIQYEFDDVYVLHEMQVWNHNSELESIVGLGIKGATIECSIVAIAWTALEGSHELARASGLAGYAASTVVDFHGAAALYVRIGADNRISGVLFFHGAVDDLRVYSTALSQGEIAWLAGARAPIDPRF